MAEIGFEGYGLPYAPLPDMGYPSVGWGGPYDWGPQVQMWNDTPWMRSYLNRPDFSKYTGVGKFPIPKYLESPPEGLGRLNPMAMQWMMQLYSQMPAVQDITMGGVPIYGMGGPREAPNALAGYTPVSIGNTALNPWQVKPYQKTKGQPAVTAWNQGVEQITQQEIPPEEGFTAVYQPELPSAQHYRRLESEGAVPVLESYMNAIFGPGAWNQYSSQFQNTWAEKSKQPATKWRVPKK